MVFGSGTSWSLEAERISQSPESEVISFRSETSAQYSSVSVIQEATSAKCSL
jgi:hypothetical protein